MKATTAHGARCRRQPNRGGGSRGFTLVELLVVLALLGFLTLVLSGVLRFGVRAWESGVLRVAEAEELASAQSLIRNLLSQARLLPARATSEIPASFLGEREQLRLLAPLPRHLALGGFYVLSLQLNHGSDGGELVVGWRLYRPDESLEDAASATLIGGSVRLLDRAETLGLEYFGAPETYAAPVWMDHWDRIDALPQLIRVVVAFSDGDGRSWPDLVVAPLAATETM